MLKYNKLLRRVFNVHPHICTCNCSAVAATKNQNEMGNIESPLAPSDFKNDTPYMPTSRPRLRSYLKSEPHIIEMSQYVPSKYFTLKSKQSIENLYLIDSKIAKDAVSRILPILNRNRRQVVCETNAGLGLIASELLDNGIPVVRLFESCADFRAALKDFNSVYPGRVELFSKDVFHASALSYLDQIDHGNRIEQLLKDVPKKDWRDEPVMSIIGPMPNRKFIKYLMKALSLQTDFTKYGRPQVFAFMAPRDYTILTATADNNLHTYQYWSVLFNLLFDWKFLCKYTRKAFLPWEQKVTINGYTRYPEKIDVDYIYFVQFQFKKQLPVELDKILHLFYFVRQFFGRGSNPIIPTIEKWFPGCGINLFLPECEHKTPFPKNIDLQTTFGELQPEEILCIFKEFINHPHYASSPFLGMVDSLLIKTETVDTDLVNDGELEKETVEELEEKFAT